MYPYKSQTISIVWANFIITGKRNYPNILALLSLYMVDSNHPKRTPTQFLLQPTHQALTELFGPSKTFKYNLNRPKNKFQAPIWSIYVKKPKITQVR